MNHDLLELCHKPTAGWKAELWQSAHFRSMCKSVRCIVLDLCVCAALTFCVDESRSAGLMYVMLDNSTFCFSMRQAYSLHRRFRTASHRIRSSEKAGQPVLHLHPCSGTLRPGGPRHDNDAVSYRNVRVVPTPSEVLCPATPYLPANR